MVDPHGELNEEPVIYCQGVVPRESQASSAQLYANVIGLFDTVMIGGLAPTNNK